MFSGKICQLNKTKSSSSNGDDGSDTTTSSSGDSSSHNWFLYVNGRLCVVSLVQRRELTIPAECTLSITETVQRSGKTQELRGNWLLTHSHCSLTSSQQCFKHITLSVWFCDYVCYKLRHCCPRAHQNCHSSVAPCGLRGCKNGPAPFPGRMSYKASKPDLVYHILACCIIVLWFIRAPFYVLLANKQTSLGRHVRALERGSRCH